jgi:D-sedoheptulose 7-phosphate isomerase
MKPVERVIASMSEHLAIAQGVQGEAALIAAIAGVWWEALRVGGQVLFCGNGGSAGDSQHLATELTSRFETERRPLRGIALTTDTSAITAIANDYGYDRVFARQVEAIGRTGDVLVAISTSGNSSVVLAAVAAARKIGMKVVGFTGADGGKLAPQCDLCLRVPSQRTARVQELHIVAGHCCCELIDAWVDGHE